ncbi:MAG: hypothetical protein NC180_02030 [Muribaculaceae bacterium]|nr:hypothetical protein [Roseburia sp.]MCM1432241.1 hypothetical protein [Muribaculaceae bacterium]MCM1491982.1 hypothetical protein [Muribaculaceae bacterium]
MKKVRFIILAVVCVALICGGFFLLKSRMGGEEEELTKVQKIMTRNLETDYPPTPREVIKFYNRIITSYYEREYTDEEFEALTDQALLLFDDELAANNPKDAYQKQIQAEVEDYRSRKRSISSTSVCDTRDVVWLTDADTGDELAYVTASYFVKENNSFDRTYQEYVLRKDDGERWKILTYYQVEGKAAEDDGDD